MNRIIKRYNSRKLYDLDEKQYVSLADIAEWVRSGDHIRVLDIHTGEDATIITLVQVIIEDEKHGASLPADFLHEVIRCGNQIVSSAVQSVQLGVRPLIDASLENAAALRALHDEMEVLRKKLDKLEARISQME